ncbi:hypothetical protein [Paraliomyxa miuraensis]|uniref:hypothetical protein n=1 Tax=Paraliomyxa miuraensis TaxID=376150 RepID=UPI002252EA32|nr:hypothetical protein [Paraliomyxa miuraensis]MCX4241791.1 hypothetical protein [Paraliomyxa miuraensis]
MVKPARLCIALSSLLVSMACGDDAPPAQDGSSTGTEPTTTTDATTGTTAVVDEGSTSSSTGEGSTDDGGPIDPEDLEWPLLECDPLVPEYCAFPFPSNVYTIPSEDTVTGRSVQLPMAPFEADPDPEPWTWSDGFSPQAGIATFLPGATAAGLPSHEDIDASLADDSPTVLIDAETGERIAHYSELDYSTDEANRRALFIRPAVRLPPARRYIVAIRGLVDAGGALVPASPAFAALRDHTDLPEEPSVEARRELYGDIFYRLGQTGVAREELQLAWDFHTASDENTTGWLLHMRDEAFAELGPTGSPPYTLDVVDTMWNTTDFLYRIEGTFQAPLYLDSESPVSGRLVHGPDGMPVANGTVDVPFWLIVPRTAETTPAALMQHGHGLLGSGSQIEGSHFREMATLYNYAVFGIDWIGMSEEDYLPIAATISTTGTTGLAVMTDRMHQGSLNQLLAMRLAWAGLAEDPLLAGLLDPDQRYWYGISQGGILGGVYMATTTEVERGVLDVLGQPYNTLLTRSVDFDPFFDLMRLAYPDPLDVAQALLSLQMLWDRVEPEGYTHRIVTDPLPNTPPHEVLMTAALGDHQVTTLGAHNMARSAGIVHLDSGIREIWGLPVAQDSHMGSALVEYDFGLPPDPVCNRPQTACNDPHGRLRRMPAARDQIDHFLRNGEVVNFCPAGVCSFPDEGMCAPGEMTPDVCQ